MKIDGEVYSHDVVILPTKIIRRVKQISKRKHGTSHKFTWEEMQHYLDMVDKSKIKLVVVGTGQYGKLSLLQETKRSLDREGIKYVEKKTPDLVGNYDGYGDRRSKIGIIHVTC